MSILTECLYPLNHSQARQSHHQDAAGNAFLRGKSSTADILTPASLQTDRWRSDCWLCSSLCVRSFLS